LAYDPHNPDTPLRQKVIIHGGFHKTGTKSIQAFLRENRKILWPHVKFLLTWRIEPLARAARGYSTWRDPVSLLKFAVRFETLLQEISLAPGQALLISSEHLSGHKPGRGDLDRYDAAPILAGEMAQILAQHFGENLDLTFAYSTRNPEAWLKSSYRHNLAGHKFITSFADYARRYALSADLPGIVADLSAAVAPHKVVALPLETGSKLPLGPGQALTDLLHLPERVASALKPVTPRNAGPDDAIAAYFLDLNRSGKSPEEISALKQAMIDKGGEEA
jgi:hypothetical protein